MWPGATSSSPGLGPHGLGAVRAGAVALPLNKMSKAEAAARIDNWANSTGLQPPK